MKPKDFVEYKLSSELVGMEYRIELGEGKYLLLGDLYNVYQYVYLIIDNKLVEKNYFCELPNNTYQKYKNLFVIIFKEVAQLKLCSKYLKAKKNNFKSCYFKRHL